MASSSQDESNPVDSKKLWTDAISLIPSKDLSAEEVAYLSQARRDDVLEDLKKFEAQHAASSTMRSVSKQISPFLDCIWSYASAIDVVANTPPMPLSPIWAVVRMAIQAARAFEEFFTKLVEMLQRIGDVLPRFDLYIQMFPAHQNLVVGVSRIYADIIQFCIKAKKVFSAEAQTEKKKFTLGSSSKAAFKVIWANFETQFGKTLDSFREHKTYIEDEAKAAAIK
jgi:fungal STAND N-terminal Goodbye domain